MTDQHQDFNPKHLAVVDLETTGLDPEIARVIQMAVILVSLPSLSVEWMRSSCIWPGSSAMSQATKQAMEVNGISSEELLIKGIPPKVAFSRFGSAGLFYGVDWNETVLASWGADFEAKFLTAEFERLRTRPPFNYRVLDIRSICGWVDAFGIGMFEGWNYSSMLDFAHRHGLKTYFDDLEVNRQHDALYDAMVSLECLRYAAVVNRHGYVTYSGAPRR